MKFKVGDRVRPNLKVFGTPALLTRNVGTVEIICVSFINKNELVVSVVWQGTNQGSIWKERELEKA